MKDNLPEKTPDILAPYLEAKEKAQLYKPYLDKFRNFTYNSDDYENASEHIRLLCSELRILITKGFFANNSELVGKIKDFTGTYFSFYDKKPMTPKEILSVEVILTRVIDALEFPK